MDPEPVGDEISEVRRRRYKEAVAAGLSILEAAMFADSDEDIGMLRRLVRDACPPELIAEIVL